MILWQSLEFLRSRIEVRKIIQVVSLVISYLIGSTRIVSTRESFNCPLFWILFQGKIYNLEKFAPTMISGRDFSIFLLPNQSIRSSFLQLLLNVNERGYCKLYSPHGFEQRLHVGIIYLQLQLGTALFLNCGKKKKRLDKDQIGSFSDFLESNRDNRARSREILYSPRRG